MNQEEECSFDKRMQKELNEFIGVGFNDCYDNPEKDNIKTTCDNNVNYEFKKITKEEQDEIIKSLNENIKESIPHPPTDKGNFVEIFEKWVGSNKKYFKNHELNVYNIISNWLKDNYETETIPIIDSNRELIKNLKSLINEIEKELFVKEMNTYAFSEILNISNDIKVDEKLVEKYNGRFLNLEIFSKHSENCNCTYCQNPLPEECMLPEEKMIKSRDK
jgi:hypothetical protein